MKDKKGITLTKMIIVPIMEEIKKLVSNFGNVCYSTMIDFNSSSDIVEQTGEKMHSIGKLVHDINLKDVHGKILKYIAPYFQLEI